MPAEPFCKSIALGMEIAEASITRARHRENKAFAFADKLARRLLEQATAMPKPGFRQQ
jgi:hypothetical protein